MRKHMSHKAGEILELDGGAVKLLSDYEDFQHAYLCVDVDYDDDVQDYVGNDSKPRWITPADIARNLIF